MARKGPVPERVANRLGHRTKAENDVTRIRVPTRATVPGPDKTWHPIALRIYKAAKASAQSKLYEPSDWAVLYFVCDEISVHCRSKNRSAVKLSAINQMLAGLVLTEGERRRAQIEIERETGVEDSRQVAVDVYSEILSG